jgi:hypothetical protein
VAIMVQFADFTFDFLPKKELYNLIATNSIIAFRRSSGWVDISKDPIRKEISAKRYLGQERRNTFGSNTQTKVNRDFLQESN